MPKKTTKPCKTCGKDMPKGLNATCSQKCEKKRKEAKDKEKRKVAREKKAVSVSALDKKLLTLWSQIVRKGGICEHCHRSGVKLDAHHVYGRRNNSVRYDLDNGVVLCSGCHTMSSIFSAHQTPTEFTDWIKDYRGEEWYNTLRERARSSFHPTSDWLQAEIERFKSLL